MRGYAATVEADGPDGRVDGHPEQHLSGHSGGDTAHPSWGLAGVPATPSVPGAARLAAVLLWAQVVVIAGFVAYFAIEFALGQASDAAAVLTSLSVFVLGAVGLSLLARAWLSGSRWPRTPTLVWQALLLPIGWSLAQTHHWLVAAAVLGVGVAGLAAAWRSPAVQRPAGGWLPVESEPGD